MKKHYLSLAEACEKNQLVVLYRKSIDDNRLEGYVVGLSSTWVLLHLVDGNVLKLDGYKAVRLNDINRFKVDETFVDEYLRLREMCSQEVPQVVVHDLHTLLRTVSENCPLFMIERERVEPGIGIAGEVEELTKRSLWMKKFNSKAMWIDTEEFRLKDITAVNFGDGYVEALAWMAAHRKGMEAGE